MGFPVGANGVPEGLQAFDVGVAVLADDCGDGGRVLEGEAEADWCAVVEDVDGVFLDFQCLEEGFDAAGEVGKGVGVGVGDRCE